MAHAALQQTKHKPVERTNQIPFHRSRASSIRPRDSSRPRTAITENKGGELVDPVSAMRSGCATTPSFRPFCSAKWRVASSSTVSRHCLLYTSDAADDLLCVDLGGRRI